jgi:hypothetical protein
LSLQQFFDDHRPATTDDPVRIFPAVARTPRLPEPRWWNNPLGVMPVTVTVAVTLTLLPGLPAFTGLMAMVISLALTVVGAISYFSWPDSRDAAVAESAWVARQSGYRISVHGDDLRWIDQHGTVKSATVVRGEAGWDLVLTGKDAAGSFSF